jgi:CRISPR-associated protein Cas5d
LAKKFAKTGNYPESADEMTQPIQRFALRIWGEFACFTRPEMKVERVSYDVMTPSAARGVFESIYWKPEIRWVIDRIHVLNPIRFTNIRRNEVASKIPAGAVGSVMKGGGPLALYIEADRQQRAALVLRDVVYIVEAHFELLSGVDNLQKHSEMFLRRVKKGQYFHHPYLGCREFDANFELAEDPIPKSQLEGSVDLGWMLHDLDFNADMRPVFFRAEMNHGVIDVPMLQSEETKS